MLLLNKTKGNSIFFENILRTKEPQAFIEAVIDREYEGTESWDPHDEYEFQETDI